MRSKANTSTANISTTPASSLAAARLYIPTQTWWMPTETVCTPKYCTVAKSVKVSMATNNPPAASEGRASGRTISRAALSGPAPRARAASYVVEDCSRRAARAKMYG